MEARRGAGDPLRLSGALTLHGAERLHETLSALMPRTGRVTVDLSGVDEIDITGWQILIAFARSRGSAGVAFAACPDFLSIGARRLGLHRWLSLRGAAGDDDA